MIHAQIAQAKPHPLFAPEVILGFLKKNMTCVIAITLALLTMLAVPPTAAYWSYFDWKTLSCLFCTLAVVCALKSVRFFTFLARRIIVLAGNTRSAILLLMAITFFGSMLMANDMALLTFLPLGYDVLSTTRQEKHMPFTFIMQNISANLGGMLTPFGNPQNLYLYEKFQINGVEFLKIMAIPFALSILMILGCCLHVEKARLIPIKQQNIILPFKQTVLYLFLFLVSILMVLRCVPYRIGFLAIAITLLLVNRGALQKVDFGLLTTFCAFFVFSGNLSRLESIRSILTRLLEKQPLLVSIASCQVISNVPTAILVSQFTSQYPALLMGVNIGGTGTLIASLASLITFRAYTAHYPKQTGRYLRLFSVFNFTFLIILTGCCQLLLALW